MRSQIIAIIVFFFVVYACSRSCTTTSYNSEYKGKTPVDNIIKKMDDENVSTFSIVLYDMNTEGTFFKDYLHKYKIIKENKEGEVDENLTDWYDVNKNYFMANVNNMGMELAAKTPDGKITKSVGPPGYGSYVGNERYGHWVNRNGNSFWEFYGKYAMLSTMFNMMSYPVQRSYWSDYRRDYYGTGRPYYGPRTSSGSYRYGTNGQYTRSTRNTSSWYTNKSNSSFKRRVQGMTSRSGSRYSSGGYRSRGGGFGK